MSSDKKRVLPVIKSFRNYAINATEDAVFGKIYTRSNNLFHSIERVHKRLSVVYVSPLLFLNDTELFAKS